MQTTLEPSAEVAVSPEMALADKLLNQEHIVKGDISVLNLFGDTYIEMLLETPQAHVRTKLAEILVHLWRDDHGRATRFDERTEPYCR